MGRLSNIEEKMDGKIFAEDYYRLRAKSLFLVTYDSEHGQPNMERIPLVPYEKISALIKYVEERDYAHRGPLRGLDLRLNGFSEVVESFEMPVYRYPSELCLTFKDEDIINASELINKLIQIESYHALLPHGDKKGNWVYVLNNEMSAGNVAKYCRAAKVYSEFLKFAEEKKKSFSYVDFVIDEWRNPMIFFPLVTITVFRRPYFIFQQKNAGSGYKHHRSRPKFKIDECLELYENLYEASGKPYPNVSSVFDKLFAFPEDRDGKINKIIEIYDSLFNEKIDAEDIYYDWVKKCYTFDSKIEEKMFSAYPIRQATKGTFYKYTSLNTLMNIVNSGKMRLNSISTMNDPTETQKLYSEGCNFNSKEEDLSDLMKFTNNYYLTSFSSEEDDLNMWRFYGDDARGVCMEFVPLEKSHEVMDVNYGNLNSEELSKIETFLVKLKKEENIDFCIESYVDHYLFIKPQEYDIEHEKRLVIATIKEPRFTVYANNIVTPYIELDLIYRSNPEGISTHKTFPLKLVRIVLGPEMKNRDLNKLQLEHLISNNDLFRGKVDVTLSNIKCYRQ